MKKRKKYERTGPAEMTVKYVRQRMKSVGIGNTTKTLARNEVKPLPPLYVIDESEIVTYFLRNVRKVENAMGLAPTDGK